MKQKFSPQSYEIYLEYIKDISLFLCIAKFRFFAPISPYFNDLSLSYTHNIKRA